MNSIGHWPDVLLAQVSDHLLPLRGVRVTLCATRLTMTRFQHTHALSAWVRHLARDAVSQKDAAASGFDQLRIDAIETGQVRYQPGDLYQFSLFCTAAGFSTLSRVLERLCFPSHHSLPVRSNDAAQAFGSHWQVESINDWFNDRRIVDWAELSTYDADTLAKEASIWMESSEHALIWQWLSPVRLLKHREKRGKGEARFCRDVEDINAELLLERCVDAVSNALRQLTDDVPPRRRDEFPIAKSQHHDVFWIQDEYHPADDKGKPKGGLLGRHRIEVPLSREWASLIVLGQYLGLGQGVASGHGRFRLETVASEISFLRGHPKRNWLERALEPSNLMDAWRHVRESRQAIPLEAEYLADHASENSRAVSGSIGTHDDAETDDQSVPSSLLDILKGRLRALHEGRYEAPYARACLLPKDDGGSRMLAIPPFWDAVLQRAVAQVLSPSLDSLMHPASYGYRRGRSRRSAAEAIQLARREGYRWIYDADIEDFFGSVDHNRLHGRLLALFDDDPIIDVIMNWVRAPVRWQGTDHPRRQGLPQGSNLSPLLANLMLDDFDNDMAAAGIRLVRFADDFVLMCKSREGAQEASIAAVRSLREHGFELHEDKSEIVDLDEGLEFLGYLFVNDYAIDTSRNRVVRAKPKRRSKKKNLVSAEHSLQMAHWLAKLGRQPPRSLSVRELEAREAGKALSRVADDVVLAVDEQFDPNGSVYLVGHGHLIYTEGGHLVVSRDDERVLQRPWQHIKHVFLMGNQHITTPALRVAARNGVNVHVSSAQGYREFSINAKASIAEQRVWLRQAITSEDPEFTVPIAREIVGSRIRHQFEVLRRRGKVSDESTSATSLLRQLSECSDLAKINGVEGHAASAFFEAFAALVPADFAFRHRARRPPPDPVNALLSIGYQVLYAHAETFLRAEKLLPAVGVYHRAGREHAALASDMIEPFRHLVEQSVLQLLRRNSLKLEQFEIRADGRGCTVLPDARRRFIADLHKRLAQPLKARGELDALSYRSLLHRQCHSIALAIEKQDPERFHVFRSR